MWPADVGVVVWSLCCAVLWERSRHGVTNDKRKLSVCRIEKSTKKEANPGTMWWCEKFYAVRRSHISWTKKIELAVRG